MRKFRLPMIVIILMSLQCTNPFEFRKSEKPGNIDNNQTDEAPTTVPRLFDKLKNAFNEKNVVKYMECLIDTSLAPEHYFQFIPDQTLPSNLFTGWDLSAERSYINRVFNEVGSSQLIYIDEPDADFDYIDSVETRFFNYEIKLINNDTTFYRGKARMKLVRDVLSNWAIYMWQDVPNDNNFPDTWSRLKADKRF